MYHICYSSGDREGGGGGTIQFCISKSQMLYEVLECLWLVASSYVCFVCDNLVMHVCSRKRKCVLVWDGILMEVRRNGN